MKKEYKRVLEMAREEIVSLRKRNELLEAQIAVVELFRALITPSTPRGMGEDVTWSITKVLRELEAGAPIEKST